ncbi:glycerophosphodiester phosphodiesterase [Neptunicella sp. SCSIO 80796]|uniref:glycerophosphodiester phosphodiesterase n=1 Tax=Neptunicella plasticusilytica TaxID=3117012 RepID=UPI003A4E14EB
MLKRLNIIIPLCLILLIGGLYISAEDAPQSQLFKQHPEFLTIGHQGGYLIWPSNTLTAYQGAADLGIDMLEMDVHLSKDNHLIVMHDATVDRTTNGVGAIKQMTLPQIRALDAGYRWLEDAPGGDLAFRDKGIQVPTLDEVFRQFPDKLMTIEIKQTQPSIVQPLCQLIHQYNMQDKVIIGSFHQSAIDQFRDDCVDVATSMASDETTLFVILSKLGLSQFYSPKGHALQVPLYGSGLEVLTQGVIDDAHAKGLKVHAWTINDPSIMSKLIDKGVDGIISDRPDYLIRVSHAKTRTKDQQPL